MWQDMGMYWAWRGNSVARTRPPYTKEVKYMQVLKSGEPYMKIAYCVIDAGERRTLVSQKEIERLKSSGMVLQAIS